MVTDYMGLQVAASAKLRNDPAVTDLEAARDAAATDFAAEVDVDVAAAEAAVTTAEGAYATAQTDVQTEEAALETAEADPADGTGAYADQAAKDAAITTIEGNLATAKDAVVTAAADLDAAQKAEGKAARNAATIAALELLGD